jgi:hypothetical protein
MTTDLAKELYELHVQNDALFRRLARQAENEPDDNKYIASAAMMSLVIHGKAYITQNAFGELVFETTRPN